MMRLDMICLTLFAVAAWAGCSEDDPVCGDGRVDGGEGCDGTDFGGMTCGDLGKDFTGGELACTAECVLDISGCTVSSTCGNGVIDGDEICDGPDLGGVTCMSMGYGYLSGELVCLASCNGFNLTDCSTVDPLCGNGEIDGNELCDGPELQGQTCQSLGLGFDGGELACRSSCYGWDVAGCTGLQTATPLPNGCLSPSYLFPGNGEESHLVAVRVAPRPTRSRLQPSGTC